MYILGVLYLCRIYLFVYKFTNFRYMNVTLNVNCTRSDMFVGTSIYIYMFPQNILDQGDIHVRYFEISPPTTNPCLLWGPGFGPYLFCTTSSISLSHVRNPLDGILSMRCISFTTALGVHLHTMAFCHCVSPLKGGDCDFQVVFG